MEKYNCVACNKEVSWKMFKNYGYCVECQAIDNIVKHGEEVARLWNSGKFVNEKRLKENKELPYWKEKINN